MSAPMWGLLAEYATVEQVLAAAGRVREAGYRQFDVHSPIPIHGLDEAMGIRPTWIPKAVLAGGAIGTVAGVALQVLTNAFDYPFLVSGKPAFGWPAGIPVAFEVTILLAALGAVGGLVVAVGWPQLYHPLLKVERFSRVTSDRFFVSIEAADPRFDSAGTRALLEATGAQWVGDVES